MNKTVLFYMNYAAPYPGNFIASIRILIKKMEERGIDAHCIFPHTARCRHWVGDLMEEGVHVSFLPDEPAQRLKLIKTILKEEHIIFVHMHFTDDIRERLILKLAMFVTGKKCPIVVHYHNHYATHNGFIKQFIKKAVMHGDYLVGCGAGVAESIKAGNFKNDITFIDNAIDFSRLKSNRNASGKRNFLQFGFDFERKGVDLSLEAIEHLIRKYPDLTLSICLASNMEYVRNKIIEKYGKIPDWVRLLPPVDDIAEYYDDACAFLSPSREEGLCYSVIEAAYCRCPVIAADISGLNEIQIPEIIWCQSGDFRDLQKQIESFLRLMEEEKCRLGERLKASAQQNYDLKRWEQQMITYYEKRGLL